MKLKSTVVSVMLACCALSALPAGAADLGSGAEASAAALRARLEADPDARGRFDAIKARVQPYVARHRSDPAWIVSRLQMYWQGKHTRIYVKNGLYDHADGTAPAPTVRFTGGRDSATVYMNPRLEDVKPYMGEGDKLYLQNREASGQPWEWAPQAKTGRIVESINMRIVALARDAALVHWVSGDQAYAQFAYDIFQTYMTGLSYRDTPIDLNQGHDQTLVGLQSFEVIHEDIVGPLTETYEFLHPYVKARAAPELQGRIDDAFRKWAELIIDNGVPWNNWNLIEARFILQIAAVLQDDGAYADQRGRQYYLNAAVEGRGVRQWSLKRLLDSGYDARSAMWNESPIYSMNVLGDYVEILELLERVFGIDLLPQMPVLARAALAVPQYLLPNARVVGFGDTRYEHLRTAAIEGLHAYALRRGDAGMAAQFARLLTALGGGRSGSAPGGGDAVHALLRHAAPAPAQADVQANAAQIQHFQTPTFHAPGPSWLVQRSGYQGADGRERALAISQAGSNGNHAHANGIAMELFAHGVNIGPESGRGSGYLQYDYRDYYSQFAAHNTVVVDGRSTYAPMKSHHPLTVDALYPASGSPAAAAFPWATFSDVSMREPETDADQRRQMGIVRQDGTSGYFVDIFRSRRRDGQDRYHDYIYHNLAQSLQFVGAGGTVLPTTVSTKLAFADNDLIGYDYWSERRALVSPGPLQARFHLQLPERSVAMHAWLQGGAGREFFSVSAPPSTAWSAGMLPAGLDKARMPTMVVRHSGQAWTRPFGVVFDPVRDGAAPNVLQVDELTPAAHAYGLRVSTAGQRRQLIMSTDRAAGVFDHAEGRLRGRYGIAAEREGQLVYLFLGHGSEVAAHGFAIRARTDGTSAALWQDGGKWRYTASTPSQLRVPASWPDTMHVVVEGRAMRLKARRVSAGKRLEKIFDMPAMAASQIR